MVRPPGITCQLCPMVFSDQSAINAHYDTAHTQSSTPRPEHPDAKLACTMCGRKFVKAHHVKRHLATVHGIGDVQSFQCDVCSKPFKEKANLKAHLSRVHGIGNVKTFQCYQCSKTFKHKADLKRHLHGIHGAVNVSM